MAQAAQPGLLIRVDTKSAEFEQKHLKGVILCDFKSAKISSPTRYVNSRIRQLFHDHPHFVHSRAGPNKVTILCSNQQTLDDCIREGHRVIEDTKDVTRVHIRGAQCVSKNSLTRVLSTHVGRVRPDSLRLSSWVRHQSDYGDIAFADVVLRPSVTLPITFDVYEDEEAVGSFTVEPARAKTEKASNPSQGLGSVQEGNRLPNSLRASASEAGGGWRLVQRPKGNHLRPSANNRTGPLPAFGGPSLTPTSQLPRSAQPHQRRTGFDLSDFDDEGNVGGEFGEVQPGDVTEPLLAPGTDRETPSRASSTPTAITSPPSAPIAQVTDHQPPQATGEVQPGDVSGPLLAPGTDRETPSRASPTPTATISPIRSHRPSD